MAKRRPKKPMLKFPKRMQKKMIVMFTVVAALMIGLIGRLMYIEYTSGEKYEKIVLAQQGYDSQTIPYQRGDIVDAKGIDPFNCFSAPYQQEHSQPLQVDS